MLCVGTLSGTSMNAKEFILSEIRGERVIPLEYMYDGFEEAGKLREIVLGTSTIDLETIALAHDLVGMSFAKSLKKFLKMVGNKPEVIGFHGQTVFHQEAKVSGGKMFKVKAITLQIGEPSFLSAVAGVPVVYDFRKSDISAGGRGAPLSPLIHYILFKNVSKKTCVLNLGGIANISLLKSDFTKVRGEDVGPANAILDFVAKKKLSIDYDKDGALSSQGRVIESVFLELKEFFKNARNRTLGVEVERAKLMIDKHLDCYKAEDILRTVLEVSVGIISEKIKKIRPDGVIVCGGGARNKFMLKRLAEEVRCPLYTSEEFGIAPEYVEPILFAYLAYLRIKGKKIDMKNITGSRFPYLPGKICEV